MGYYGKLEERIKAQSLRKRGLSYKEILQYVSVSKSTLSEWLKDTTLNKKQQLKLLEKRKFGQRKGSIIAAENKRRIRIKRTLAIFREARKKLGRLDKRDRFLAGIALYAAEGDKTDGKGGLANSDPRIIKFMMQWFKEFCDIPDSKFRGAIWLHEGRNEEKAKRYWSQLTGIPINQFHKTYVAENKTKSRKIRKNIHEYGVFAIRFSDSERHRLIMGWISALLGARIKTVH